MNRPSPSPSFVPYQRKREILGITAIIFEWKSAGDETVSSFEFTFCNCIVLHYYLWTLCEIYFHIFLNFKYFYQCPAVNIEYSPTMFRFIYIGFQYCTVRISFRMEEWCNLMSIRIVSFLHYLSFETLNRTVTTSMNCWCWKFSVLIWTFYNYRLCEDNGRGSS